MSELDKQVAGDHYKQFGEMQPVKVLQQWLNPDEFKGYVKGQVIAYLAREADKNGRQDIEKAHHWLGLYLELTEKPAKIDMPILIQTPDDGIGAETLFIPDAHFDDALPMVEWAGGEMPVDSAAIVQFVMRNGMKATGVANQLSWVHTNHSSDLVAYRILEDK